MGETGKRAVDIAPPGADVPASSPVIASPVIALARACHPEPVVAVTAIATALAVAAGQSTAMVLAVALAVLTGQLSIGWSNDCLDRGRDALSERPDKPVAGGLLAARTVAVAALVALVACVPLSLASGWRAGVVHLLGVGLGWAYNLRFKMTVLSVVPYALAFALLPAFVVLGLPGHPAPPWWLLAAGALLGSGAHLTNTLSDLADDARTGVRGLPHRLGERRSRTVAACLLVAASMVITFGPGRPGPLLGLMPVAILVVVAGTLWAGSGRATFRMTIAVAAIDLALLVAAGRDLT